MLLKPCANVRDFGAVGDGATDDTPAIRCALASGAGAVYFPAGTYKVTGELTVPQNVHVYGDGADASIVTAKGISPGSPGFTVFSFAGGGFSQIAGLAADVKRFDVSIRLKSAAGILPDDVLVLHDPRESSYSTFRKYYKAGEFVQISELVGNEVRVVGGLQADYRAQDVKLYRMENPTRSSIRNLTVIGIDRVADSGHCCIVFQHGRGVLMRDIRVSGTHYALCKFATCFGALAENVEGDQIYPRDSATGLNYGIVVANSQDVRILNSRLTALRHAVAIGGGGGGPNNPNPVNRQISVTNCDLKSYGQFALDAHGNTELYTFQNNRVHGGIDFGGMLGRIIGNDIYGRNAGVFGTALYSTEWKGVEFEIRNNRIHTPAVNGHSAIWLNVEKGTVIGGPTIVADNRIFMLNSAGADWRGIYAQCNGAEKKSMWVLIIDTNDVYADGTGQSIRLERKSGLPLAAIIVRNNTLRGGTVYIQTGAAEQELVEHNWPTPTIVRG